MLRVVLFYGWIMQEKETPVIREGEKNVSLQSTAGVQGDAVLLPGPGVPPAHFPLLPGRSMRPASGA